MLMYKAKCHGSLACGSFEVFSNHHDFKDMRLKNCVSAVCIHSITDRNDSPTYSKYGGNLQACHCLILQQRSFRLVNIFKPIYVSHTFVLTVSFKLSNNTYVAPHVAGMSVSFMSCIVQIISIDLAWIL